MTDSPPPEGRERSGNREDDHGGNADRSLAALIDAVEAIEEWRALAGVNTPITETYSKGVYGNSSTWCLYSKGRAA